jgi:hypothetical protein
MDSAPPLDIHTCDSRVEVNINRWLQNVLREECTLDDNQATAFDIWLHTQMILTDYNRA